MINLSKVIRNPNQLLQGTRNRILLKTRMKACRLPKVSQSIFKTAKLLRKSKKKTRRIKQLPHPRRDPFSILEKQLKTKVRIKMMRIDRGE